MRKRIEKKIIAYNNEIKRLEGCLKLTNLGKLKKRDSQLMIDMYEKLILDLTFILAMPPVWPDDVRLTMVDKSEFYGDPRIYQYGYYDGFMKGVTT